VFEKTLVPLDGARSGTRVMPLAIEIAKKFNSEVLLLEVIKPFLVVRV
jgi:nucleotide-binding universal stress UspA family protein